MPRSASPLDNHPPGDYLLNQPQSSPVLLELARVFGMYLHVPLEFPCAAGACASTRWFTEPVAEPPLGDPQHGLHHNGPAHFGVATDPFDEGHGNFDHPKFRPVCVPQHIHLEAVTASVNGVKPD